MCKPGPPLPSPLVLDLVKMQDTPESNMEQSFTVFLSTEFFYSIYIYFNSVVKSQGKTRAGLSAQVAPCFVPYSPHELLSGRTLQTNT